MIIRKIEMLKLFGGKAIRKKTLTPITLLFLITTVEAADVHLTFKDSVMVNDTIIRLSDVASIECKTGSENNARLREFVIGDAAPAGYSRFVGRDDLLTYQLQPSFSSLQITVCGPVRTRVKTDFVNKTIADIRPDIVEFLSKEIAWPLDNYTLTIMNETESFKIINKPFKTQFSNLLTNKPRGQFNLPMKVIQGSKNIRITVNCNLKVVMPVVVASEAIERNSVITSDKCKIESVDITHLGITPYDALDQVVGKKAVRMIQVGQLINKQYVDEIPAIEKGDPVKIIASNGSVRVSVGAVAREPGKVGEKIWVENAASHRLVRVLVKSKGIVTSL